MHKPKCYVKNSYETFLETQEGMEWLEDPWEYPEKVRVMDFIGTKEELQLSAAVDRLTAYKKWSA